MQTITHPHKSKNLPMASSFLWSKNIFDKPHCLKKPCSQLLVVNSWRLAINREIRSPPSVERCFLPLTCFHPHLSIGLSSPRWICRPSATLLKYLLLFPCILSLYQYEKDAVVQPSLIIVYFGGNDSMGCHSSGLGPHVPLPEYIENMRKIANHLKSLSDQTRIIFLSCPPVNEERLRQSASSILSELVRSNEACRRYSEACIELCLEMGLKVIDLWTAVQKRDDWRTVCFTDGVHFSPIGSMIVVEEILKVLKEAEWEPSLHWKSLPTEFAEDSPYDLVASDGKTTVNISEGTFHREIQWD